MGVRGVAQLSLSGTKQTTQPASGGIFHRLRHRATFHTLLFLNLQKTPPTKEKTETNATSASTDMLKDPARIIKDRPVNATLNKKQKNKTKKKSMMAAKGWIGKATFSFWAGLYFFGVFFLKNRNRQNSLLNAAFSILILKVEHVKKHWY